MAQIAGESILQNKGFITFPFGEDRRFENVWEAGQDKPDCYVVSNDRQESTLCLLDWKGKRSAGYRINKRAYKSYLSIADKIKKCVVLAMAKFNINNDLTEFKYIVIPDPSLSITELTEWDNNVTVNFPSTAVKNFYSIEEYFNTLIK